MSSLAKLIEAAQNGHLELVRQLLDAHHELINQRDDSGASPLHYAAMNGHRPVVRLLLERGANINSVDSRVGATPTGWAIEYLREMGGYLAIELDDLAYAIRIGDARWATRFLQRFPALRDASATDGTPFRQLARQSRNRNIAKLFGVDGSAD